MGGTEDTQCRKRVSGINRGEAIYIRKSTTIYILNSKDQRRQP